MTAGASCLPADRPSQDTLQLAIETSGRSGSLALLAAESTLWQVNLDVGVRTAAALAPQIERSLRWCAERGQTLGFVSVADGPGSFTGLRIGVTAAKTLSYALGLPLAAVDSLAAIAAAAFDAEPAIDALLVATDAYRGQVFRGEFDRQSLLPPITGASSDAAPDWTAHPSSVGIVSQSQWRLTLASVEPSRGLVGDSAVFAAAEGELIRARCDAVGVGLLGYRAASFGNWVDPLQLVPRYLRPSAAEEKISSAAVNPSRS